MSNQEKKDSSMNREETFKEKRHHRFWLGAVMCRRELFKILYDESKF